MCTVLSETVMAHTLRGYGDGCFSETARFPPPLAAVLARSGQDHRQTGGHDTQLVVVTGAVRGRRLADELGEPGGEGAEARPPDGEADIGHAQVAPAQQRLGPLYAPGHEIGVRRLGVRLAETATEVG